MSTRYLTESEKERLEAAEAERNSKRRKAVIEMRAIDSCTTAVQKLREEATFTARRSIAPELLKEVAERERTIYGDLVVRLNTRRNKVSL
jgi:hypothetical protein